MAKYLDYDGLVELVSKMKGYTDEKVAEISADLFSVVSSLPSTGEAGKVYLVKSSTTGSNNLYTEYIWVDSDWEKLGEMTVDVDLSGYVNSVSASGTSPLTLSASISSNKLTITGSVSAATTSAAGTMSAADKTKLDSIDETAVVQKVSASGSTPLTLSGSIASNTLTLTGSVATATTSALGVVKVTAGNGLALSSGTLSMSAASSSAAGAMSSTQYTQLANLASDSLYYATAITTAEIDALF